MTSVDPRMLKFLRRHHILTLATCVDSMPWCCTCFYVFDVDNQRFILTSDKNTRHINEVFANQQVAGSIALETRIIGKIQGIQFSGRIEEIGNDSVADARKQYLKRFPYAAPFIGSTALWSIEVDHLKMTDNTLGFGKKLFWYKNT